jgi:uncharacterized repeat protein (TIGR01451 family)
MLVIAAPAFAQKNGAIETRLEARKVTRTADGETFTSAASVKPGDVIEYVATYRNTTAEPVRNLEATLPIPANTEIVPHTARPASAKASLDAVVFAAMPLTRRVQRDGKEIEEPVAAREYRYLRWYPGELAGGKSASFSARVRVVDERIPRPADTGGGK